MFRVHEQKANLPIPGAIRVPQTTDWTNGRPPYAPDPKEEIDILIPLGKGSTHNNLELRYALRSIERYARGFARVVVAGEDPGFLNLGPRCVHIPLPERQDGNHESRIAQKLSAVLRTGRTSSHVAMWNDDYVLTKNVDVRVLPFYHKGTLRVLRQRSNDRYRRALHLTHVTLQSVNLPRLNYDVHVPMLLQRDLFAWLQPWWDRSSQTGCGLVVKSVYANHVLPTQGHEVADCKLREFDGATIQDRIGGRFVFSYSDSALLGGLDRWLGIAYPNRSVFEV